MRHFIPKIGGKYFRDTLIKETNFHNFSEPVKLQNQEQKIKIIIKRLCSTSRKVLMHPHRSSRPKIFCIKVNQKNSRKPEADLRGRRRRGRWGFAPSLFFAIFCFFAITSKNYKLFYLKLN